MSAVLLVQCPVGVSKKTLPMMKFPNGVGCLFQRRSLRQSLRPMLLIVTGWRTMLNIKGRKRLRLIRHSQCETVAASSPTRVDSSAEGVRGQFGPQDSESTPQSVQVARLDVVGSQVGKPEVFPLAADDSDQFGEGEGHRK